MPIQKLPINDSRDFLIRQVFVFEYYFKLKLNRLKEILIVTYVIGFYTFGRVYSEDHFGIHCWLYIRVFLKK